MRVVYVQSLFICTYRYKLRLKLRKSLWIETMKNKKIKTEREKKNKKKSKKYISKINNYTQRKLIFYFLPLPISSPFSLIS